MKISKKPKTISKAFLPHGKKQEELKSITYQDILSMSKAELEKTIMKYSNYLNKRYERLEKAILSNKDVSADAYEYMQKSRGGRLFSTIKEDSSGQLQDMTIDELRSELNQEVYFANLKTSSVTGARVEQWRRESVVRDALSKQKRFQKLLEKDEQKAEEYVRQKASEFWEEFSKLKENYKRVPSDVILEKYKKYYEDKRRYYKKMMEEDLDDLNNADSTAKKIKEASNEATEQTGYQNPFGDNTLYNEIDKELTDKERFPFG